MTTLTELLNIADDRAGPAASIRYGTEELTIGDLKDQSARLASALRERGIGTGDRVALWLPNTPAYLALLFACARIGAIAVAVNTKFRSVEVADIVSRSGAKALAVWPGFKGIAFQDILADIPAGALSAIETVITYGENGDDTDFQNPVSHATQHSFDTLLSAAPMAEHCDDAGTGAAIFTTSGTTKAPKFVLHSQRSLAGHALDCADAFGWRMDDSIMLQALPLCGVFGLTHALGALASGNPMIMLSSFDPLEAAGIMQAEKITYLGGSDEMFDMILDAVPDQPVPFPHFRLGSYAKFNAALDDIVARAAGRGMQIGGVYGMSEVQALLSRWPDDMRTSDRQRGGGIPISPETSIRVRDPESGELLPVGEAGELEIRCPSMMTEYFGNPEATAEALTEDGHVRTGDLAMLTEDGGFEFLSRMGDVLRLGGYLVAPAEIEAQVLSHTDIADVQVVSANIDGRPRAVAFVIVANNHALDEADVIAHCKAGLAGYKVPGRVVPLDAFPTTDGPNGVKIQKNKLREMAAGLT